MDKLNVVEILRLGIIGLAFLLAFLAFHILRTEQKLNAPRAAMLKAAYLFMLFALAMCALTIFNGLKEKTLAAEADERKNQAAEAAEQRKLAATADADKRRLQAVPDIDWTASSTDGLFLQCSANGKDIGAKLDCRTYHTCDSSEGNRRVCAGVYYKQAIAREHALTTR